MDGQWLSMKVTVVVGYDSCCYRLLVTDTVLQHHKSVQDFIICRAINIRRT